MTGVVASVSGGTLTIPALVGAAIQGCGIDVAILIVEKYVDPDLAGGLSDVNNGIDYLRIALAWAQRVR